MGTGDILLQEGRVAFRWISIPEAVLLEMLHAKETGISLVRLGLWLVCAITFTSFK